MTDKLIVDNIDVSKCKFLIISNDKHLCRCIKSDLFGGIEFVENAKNGNCKDNPNCYYKQLQQEKQNSQEARDTAIEEFNRAEELNTLLKHKQQECQQLINKNNRLEEKLNTTKLLLEGKNNQYAAAVQECDRLKHDNDYKVGALEKTIDNLVVGNEGLKKQVEVFIRQLEKTNKEVIKEKEKNATQRQKNERLEQTLTEIKEIAEPFCDTCQKFEPEKKDRNNIYCRFCNYGRILQKISEVNND